MPLQRKSIEDEESVQKKEAFGSNLGAAQLKGTEEEESVQKKESGNGESFSPAAESGGSGGLGPVQHKMESAFNSDFSNVNVHENSQKASDIGALAYTQGNDVHFAPGQFKPDTQGGQELIGHELTHVVQQRENRVTPTTQTKSDMPVNDDKGLEGEADHMGAKAARGENTGMNGGASNAAGPEVQAKVASVPTFLPVADPIQQKSDGEEEETSQKKEAPFSKEVDMGDATPPADANSNPGQFKMAPFQLKAQAPVQKAAGDPPATESAAPATVVQLANGFNPPADVAGYLNENHKKWVTINAAMGSIASGPLKVRQKTKPSEDGSTPGTYEIKSGQGLDLKMGISFLNPLAANGILPVIALNASDVNNITGFLSFRVGETVMPDPRALITQINQNLEMFGLMGVTPITVPDYQNEVVGGILTLMAPTLNTQVGGFMNATGNFGLVDGNFVFHIEADVTIDGLAHGLLMIERNEEGHFNGEADIDVTVQNLSGNVKVVYANGSVTGRGTANIQSEKFSGSLTMIYDEEAIANAAVHEGLGIETMSGGEGEVAADAPSGGKKVIAGFGSVTVQLTDWLTATANVGVDSQGHVTIHGQLGFPDQVELMEQQDKKKDLFNVEIKAGYGIPLVGQVFLFASVGMFVKGGFGPLVLKDIIMEGTYSTDPNVLQNFKIGGTLAIGAYAALGLQVRAGVGLTLLGHDIKAGIDVDAMAGIQAYAEATPTFEYFEKDSDGQKVGEAHLKGHFEAAARLFLELAGAFFVEVDAPWWSPCPDKTWEWPFGSVTYPIGDSLGVGADVDWLVGSPDVPEVAFSPVEFDPDKFVSDMTKEPDDFGADGPGGDQEQQGEWTDAGGGENQLEGDPQAPTAEGGGQPQEDLSKLSSEEKYMRALGEIGEIAEGCNTKPVPDAVLRTRCNAIKSKYGINQVTLRNRQKDSIEIYVQHGSQNNRDNVIKCKVISEHERDLQFQKAVDDLNKMLEVFGAPETGAVTRSQITTAAKEVDIAHEVIVDTEVRDQGQDWVVFGDIEETKRKMTQKPKAELLGVEDGTSETSPSSEESYLINENEGTNNGELTVETTMSQVVSFYMNGADHEITITDQMGELETLMASNIQKTITTKIANQKRSTQHLINASTDPADIAHYQSLLTMLTNAESQYNTERSQAKSNYDAKIAAGLDRNDQLRSLRNKYLKAAQRIGEKLAEIGDLFGIKDLETMEAHVAIEMFNTAKRELEKSLNKSVEGGDGHNNTAAAAEQLGWVHSSGATHDTRLGIELVRLNEAKSKIDVLNAKFGTLIADHIYDEIRDLIGDCNLALGSPHQYLVYNRFRDKRNLYMLFRANPATGFSGWDTLSEADFRRL
ncbi:MAG: DUF4157 domain-containing protein [Bacteroidia bacterium]|nr:DUF4157 domain-containing protein [Bacteroidia bacterium]